jgi:dihydrofolate reductase
MNVIFSMSVSVDGFIAGPHGEIDWSVPDDELHQFHNDRVRELGAHLLGRRLYEVMVPWETDPALAASGDVEQEFADIWKALPKIVFSSTLDSVAGNARLATADPAEELARLRAESDKDVGVGGAALAATLTRLGLIDEYQLFFAPVVLGRGRPFFPPLDDRIQLDLVETRTFASRVVYHHYRRR